jgi:hypothetical protein
MAHPLPITIPKYDADEYGSIRDPIGTVIPSWPVCRVLNLVFFKNVLFFFLPAIIVRYGRSYALWLRYTCLAVTACVALYLLLRVTYYALDYFSDPSSGGKEYDTVITTVLNTVGTQRDRIFTANSSNKTHFDCGP